MIKHVKCQASSQADGPLSLNIHNKPEDPQGPRKGDLPVREPTQTRLPKKCQLNPSMNNS